VKLRGTYRQRILVVFNLRSGWVWFVSEVSQTACQLLRGTVTVEQEMCHTSPFTPMRVVHLTICHSAEWEKESAKTGNGAVIAQCMSIILVENKGKQQTALD
jgi:hypothetical protein